MTQFVTTFNVRHSGGGNHQRLRNWVLCRRGPKACVGSIVPALAKIARTGHPTVVVVSADSKPRPPVRFSV